MLKERGEQAGPEAVPVPSRAEWRLKFFLETVVLGAAGIGLVIWSYVSSERAEDLRLEQDLKEAEAEADRARERLRVEILGEWLPEFLQGDRDHAQRMIIAMHPEIAEETFEELGDRYARAGLLDDDLAAEIDRAHEDSSRAAAAEPGHSVVVEAVSDEGEAEELVSDLEQRGISDAELRATDGTFSVVVPDLPSLEAAEAVEAIVLDEGVGEASVTDNAEAERIGAPVAVPQIHNRPEVDARAALADAGFTDVVVWRVPSSSVAAGRARQLVLNDGSSISNETVVADAGGVRSGFATLPGSTPLALKISTGP